MGIPKWLTKFMTFVLFLLVIAALFEVTEDPAINQLTLNKMFVGGLKDSTTEDMVVDVFSQYEEIREIKLMIDRATGRSRGFCFVTFEDCDSVDKCVLRKYIELNSRKVEVKKAFAKVEMDPRGSIDPNMSMEMPMERVMELPKDVIQ